MGPTGYGLLQAAHGIGALSATFTVATVAPRITRRGPWLFAGAAALGFVLMGFAYSPHIRVAWPLLVLVGFCNTFYLTQTSTYLQQRVPDHLRGRVMSLYSLCWNLMPLGGLLAGVLAALVDARFAVLVGGGMVAANALLLFGSARLRAIR
jgi:sugar phosphate permease